MKKRLLFLGLAAGIISFNASAQLALQNFNSGTLPTGWLLKSDGHTVSTSFANAAIEEALDTSGWINVSGITDTSGDDVMITTSLFTPAATANRWLISPEFAITSADQVLYWQDYDLGSGETIHVYISPTGDTAAGSWTQLYDAPAGSGAFYLHQLPIGTYTSSTARIAFVDDTTNNWALALDNVGTEVLNALDLGVTNIYMYPYVKVGSSNAITGNLVNYGVTTTTSVNLNYSINGGTPVVTALTGLSIPLGYGYVFTSGTNWVPATAGIYTIKTWADHINGSGVDGNHSNDTATTIISVIDTLQPKKVLIEEFNQASCDPCAEATPNVDSVYINNINTTSMVRYHVDFPGRDCMDSVTLIPFVQDQLTYYDVTGVPDAQVDGQYVYPGAGSGNLGTPVLQAAATVGSPVTITVVPAFNAATQTYSFTATIKSAGALPAGLKLRAALTVDTITYTAAGTSLSANQSTETIAQNVFPQVAENMFPNAAGTTLAAFTDGSTQTVTGTWVKNHPWGSDRAVWAYDSTTYGQIVVWVENDSYDFVYQSANARVSTVSTDATEAVNAVVSNNASLNVYPNPASQTATVSLNLTAANNVKMEVYNMVGQLVYSMPAESRNSGTSFSTINVSNFASGDYMVRVTVGSEVLNKKLTIAK